VPVLFSHNVAQSGVNEMAASVRSLLCTRDLYQQNRHNFALRGNFQIFFLLSTDTKAESAAKLGRHGQLILVAFRHGLLRELQCGAGAQLWTIWKLTALCREYVAWSRRRSLTPIEITWK
jgi:hypothetical protein